MYSIYAIIIFINSITNSTFCKCSGDISQVCDKFGKRKSLYPGKSMDTGYEV